MFKNCIPTLVLLIMSFSMTDLLCAQNLIPNPGFEAYYNPPTGNGHLYEAVGWNNINGGMAWPNASPDFFHSMGSGQAQLPNSFAGTISPNNGNGIAGFITFNALVGNYREYLGVCLDDTLEIGTLYNLSFSVSSAHSNNYGRYGTDNIGIALTVGNPTQSSNEVVEEDPQFEIATVIHHGSWVQYSYSFIATQKYTHLTMGNFRDDQSTTRMVFSGGTGIAYYFVDDFRLANATSLPIEGLELSARCEQQAIHLDWGYPNDLDQGEWVLERSMDQETFHGIVSFDQDDFLGDYVDESAFPNLEYFYRIRHVSEEGEVEYSNLVKASFEGVESYVAGDIYPNPVKDQFSIEFANGEPGDLDLKIYDMQGREVHHSNQRVELGEHLLGFNLDQELASGVYHATFNFQGEQFTRKIVSAN